MGVIVTNFFGTSILSNEFVMIGRASTNNLGYFWVCAPNVAHVATGGKKWLKLPTTERNDIDQVMATQRWAKSGCADNFKPMNGNFSHIFEIRPPYLLVALPAVKPI